MRISQAVQSAMYDVRRNVCVAGGCLPRNTPYAFGGFNAVNAYLALMRCSLVTNPSDAKPGPAKAAIDTDNRTTPQRKRHSYNACANRCDVGRARPYIEEPSMQIHTPHPHRKVD
jgi:hypothetical protein